MPVTYEELHEFLRDKETKLREQLEDMHSDVREEGVGYSNHMADAGTEVFEQARDVTLVRRIQRSYENVKHALEKFDDGTYGICEGCGAIIDMARLEVVPEAQHCVRCQTRIENKSK